MSDAIEIIQATFQEIHPGRGNDYTEHPIIKKYLEETTLDPLACSMKKRLRKDFRGSSAIIFQINASKTWFGHGTLNCFDAAQVEDFFRSEEITLRRTTTLGKASVITYACSGPESAVLGQVDVDILVHSATNTWRATLEAWLDPATNPQVVKFEWKAIQTGAGTPYQRDPTVQKFLRESTLDPTVAGKRSRVDLAGPSGVSPKKAGRKPGWRKPRPGDAADATGPGEATGSTVTVVDAQPRAAPRRSLSSVGSSPAGPPQCPRGRGRGRGHGAGQPAAAGNNGAVASPQGSSAGGWPMVTTLGAAEAAAALPSAPPPQS